MQAAFHEGLHWILRDEVDRKQLEGWTCFGDIWDAFVNAKVPPNGRVLDVGAHIGTFALPAAKFLPDGEVFACEPEAASARVYRANAALNGIRNARLLECAVGSQTGEITLYEADEHWASSTVATVKGRPVQVQCLSLHDLMFEVGWSSFDLLKMNCEGAEYDILTNTPATDLACFRVIFSEMHADLAPDADVGALMVNLELAGFDVRTYPKEGSDHRYWLEAILS